MRSYSDRPPRVPRWHGCGTEAEEIRRITSASVRDMLDTFRIQASAEPVTDKALEEIVFRAEHGVVQNLAPYPGPQRVPGSIMPCQL